MKVYKFVSHEITELESLKDSKIYQALEKAENGNLESLKNMFIDSFQYNNLINGYYRLMGWHFDIKDYCNRYLVRFKYDSRFTELYAPNKTTLYKAIGGRHLVSDIIEVNKK